VRPLALGTAHSVIGSEHITNTLIVHSKQLSDIVYKLSSSSRYSNVASHSPTDAVVMSNTTARAAGAVTPAVVCYSEAAGRSAMLTEERANTCDQSTAERSH
jgi:hypothetical protein